MPQTPQLAGSISRSTQTSLQLVSPASQRCSRAHWPAKQISPAPQTLPQTPQLAGSVRRSTHTPSQEERPSAHARSRMKKQFPSTQPRTKPGCPSGHTLPHVPQLFTSVRRSTQIPPHSVVPAGQTMGVGVGGSGVGVGGCGVGVSVGAGVGVSVGVVVAVAVAVAVEVAVAPAGAVAVAVAPAGAVAVAALEGVGVAVEEPGAALEVAVGGGPSPPPSAVAVACQSPRSPTRGPVSSPSTSPLHWSRSRAAVPMSTID